MVDPDQDGGVAVRRRDIRPRYLGLDIQVQISDLKNCFWPGRGVHEYQMRNTMDGKTAEFLRRSSYRLLQTSALDIKALIAEPRYQGPGIWAWMSNLDIWAQMSGQDIQAWTSRPDIDHSARYAFSALT